MLRTSVRSVSAAGNRTIAAAAGRQWQPAIARSARVTGRRCFTDDKKAPIDSAKLPTSETNTAAASQTPPVKLDSQVVSKTINTKDVPRPPPGPEKTAESKLPSTPPAPVKKKKGFFRRLRNFVFTLILLGAVSFGGGIWYSRFSNRFHDFFTEFVPFGEQAVLYFEEMDLKKRYPGGNVTGSSRAKDTGAQVKISPQSGASWRVADNGEPAGRTSSAVHDASAGKATPDASQPKDSKGVVKAKSKKESKAKEAAKPEEPAVTVPAPATSAVVPKSEKKKDDFKAPEVDEPSRFPPAAPLDPLKVNDAEEPVVQELVKMLNDIITVVNADNADDRFSATIFKAKSHLNKVGLAIKAMKARAEEDAAAQVADKVTEFEKMGAKLVTLVDKRLADQEIAFREEFEAEMKHMHEVYDTRFKTEVERQKLVSDVKLKNQLLDQAVQLKRQFLKEVSDMVEKERNGRLGKLEQLSAAVKELENLTTGWNDVVDMNLKTQQLHVAVEAVRASLHDSEHPRPFVRELVALREIASDDAAVNAAIASINPSAYQRGISTPAQLIDRFRRVATEVRKASLLPDDAGVASHASSWMLSKVMFKKQGLAAGDDVESILTRTQTYLEEGDLDNAAREMNQLQGWAKMLSRDWLNEVRKVLEVQQALEVISTEARLQSLKVEQ